MDSQALINTLPATAASITAVILAVWKVSEWIGYRRENKYLRESIEKLIKIIEGKDC